MRLPQWSPVTAVGVRTRPRAPSARAFAMNSGRRWEGGKAKKTSRWQREQAGQVEAFQLGDVKASTISALGSGYRLK